MVQEPDPSDIHGTDRPDIAFYPPVLAGLAPLAAWLFQKLRPIDLLPETPLMQGLGLAALLIGLGLGGWAVLTFRRGGTHVSPHQPALKVMEGGPYRFTRNPMYLGIVLIQVAIALATQYDWAYLIAPFCLAALHYGVVLREEAYLTAKFGETYTAYLARTSRWL